MKKIRCFLAVELSDELAGSVERLINELAPSAHGVKWVEPDNLHLTLKFFGEIDELETYEISKTVNSALGNFVPFQIQIAELGAFPDLERPRTLWVGVGDGRDAICSLQSEIDDRLGKLGYPSESRKYEPHLTLGRVRDKVGRRELVTALHQLQAFECGRANGDSVVLFSSELRRHGPIYTRIATCPIGRD